MELFLTCESFWFCHDKCFDGVWKGTPIRFAFECTGKRLVP